MLLSLFYSFSNLFFFIYLSTSIDQKIMYFYFHYSDSHIPAYLCLFSYPHIYLCWSKKIFISFLSNDRIRMAFRVDCCCRCRCRHEDEKVREKTNRRTKWQNHERVFVKHPLLIWWLSEVNNVPVSQAGVLLDPMSITYDFDMETKFEAGSRSIFLGSNPVSEHFTLIYSTFDMEPIT